MWFWHGQFDGREKLGWIWTNSESFPYFYLPSIDRWTFYKNAENLALFYDYQKKVSGLIPTFPTTFLSQLILLGLVMWMV